MKELRPIKIEIELIGETMNVYQAWYDIEALCANNGLSLNRFYVKENKVRQT